MFIMIQKTIFVGLLIMAFVAGSITTGVIAFADDDDGNKKGKKFKALWKAIGLQQDQIDEHVTSDGDLDSSNELQDLIVVQRESSELTTSDGFVVIANAFCLDDETVIGGGWDSTCSLSNVPFSKKIGDRWSVAIVNGCAPLEATMKSFALCAKLSP